MWLLGHLLIYLSLISPSTSSRPETLKVSRSNNLSPLRITFFSPTLPLSNSLEQLKEDLQSSLFTYPILDPLQTSLLGIHSQAFQLNSDLVIILDPSASTSQILIKDQNKSIILLRISLNSASNLFQILAQDPLIFQKMRHLIDCNQNCASCQGLTGICQSCEQGYSLSGNQCIDCSQYYDNCFLCGGQRCTACEQGYYYDDGECIICQNLHSQCLECSQTSSSCLQCSEGYFPHSTQICAVCNQVLQNCETCMMQESEVICQQCENDLEFIDGECVEVCQVDNCKECLSRYECDTCEAGFYLTSGSCNICESKYGDGCIFCDTDNCIDCNLRYDFNTTTLECDPCQEGCLECNKDTCLICDEGYLLQNSDCKTCDQVFPGCISCTDQECFQCTKDTYMWDPNDYSCTPCSEIDPNCRTCNYKDQCLTCSEGQLIGNVCSLCTDITEGCIQCQSDECSACGDGYYFNDDSSTCNSCTQQYGENCRKCTQNSCTACQPGLGISEGQCSECFISYCHQCQGLQGCSECQEGYYVNSYGECRECQIAYGSDCIVCNSSSCLQCKQGSSHFLSSCISCSFTCKECSSYGLCLSCNQGYYFNDGQCRSCDQIQNCLECLTQDACYTCDTQNDMISYRGECITCQQIPNCLSCDQKGCINCQSSFQLTSSGNCCENNVANCNQCDQNGCAVCQTGYYLDQDKNCRECEDNLCEECSDQNTCDLCSVSKNEYIVSAINNEGVCECDQQSYESDGECYLLCDLCLSCTADHQCVCVQNATYKSENGIGEFCECDSEYFERQGLCVQDGFYFEKDQIQAEMNEEFTKIMVYFEEEATVTDSECEDIVMTESIQLLGLDPICLWTSTSSLEIVLGSESMIGIDREDEIVLNGSNIQRLEQIEGMEVSYIDLDIEIEIGELPQPEVRLVAPSSFSQVCGVSKLRVYVEGKLGELTYKWSIYSVDNISQEIQQLVDEQTSEILEIDQALLINSQYTIEVRVQNKFGSTQFLEQTIQIVDQQIIIVYIDSSFATMKPFQTRNFAILVSDTCYRDGSIDFSWQFVESTKETENSDYSNVLENSKKDHILTITPYDLESGFTYTFKGTASVDNLSGEALLTIQVVEGEIVTIIRSKDRIGSIEFDLFLDGSQSYDQDQNTILDYEWTCSQNGVQCTGIDEVNIMPSESNEKTLTIPKQDLRFQDQYQFTLTVSNGERSNSESIKVKIGRSQVLVTQKSETLQKVNFDQNIVLTTQQEGTALVFNWVAQIGQAEFQKDSSYISFQPEALDEGIYYEFNCTAQDEAGRLSSIAIGVKTNASPVCLDDSFKISPSSGQPLSTVFTISIGGCYDRDGQDYPLYYSFGIDGIGLTPPSLSNQIQTTLPGGLSQMTWTVCDSLHACYTRRSNINLPDFEEQGQDLIQLYQKMIQNPDQIMLAVASLSQSVDFDSEILGIVLQDIQKYLSDIQMFDQITGNAVIETYSMLSYQNVSEGYTQIILNDLSNFIDEIYYKLNEQIVDSVFSAIDNLIMMYPYDLEMDSDERFETVFEIIKVIDKINQNSRILVTPEQETTELSYQHFTSYIQVLENNEITGNITIQIQNSSIVLPKSILQQDELTTISMILITNFTDESSLLQFSLFNQGSIKDNQLNLLRGARLDLEDVSPIQIVFPCKTLDSEDHQCQYWDIFDQDQDQWKDDDCDLNSAKNGICSVHSTHTTIFRVTSDQTKSSDDQDGQDSSDSCENDLTPLVVLIPIIVITLTIMIIACSIKNKEVEPKDKTLKSDNAIDLRTYDEKFSHESNSENANRDANSLSGQESREFRLSIFKPHHLVMGQFREYYLPRYKRAFLLGLSLMVNLLFAGAFLQAWADTTQEKEYSPSQIGEYIMVPFFSSISSAVVITILDFVMYKGKSYQGREKTINILSWIFMLVIAFLSFIGVCFMILTGCADWNLLWTYIFMISIGFDLLLFQSILAMIKMCVGASYN